MFLDALGDGSLLSSELHNTQFAPSTAGIGSWTDTKYWGMGFQNVNGWVFLNPGLPGYSGSAGTIPEKGWTMVVYVTSSQASDEGARPATEMFQKFSSVVAPENSLVNAK